MPQSWDMGHIILLPLRRKTYWGFFGCPKNPTGLNPRTLVPVASMLTTRPPKPSRMRNVSDKSCKENENTHFMFSNIIFSFENRAVYEIMWKNFVERSRPQMTIWRMRIACWVTLHTHTHTHTHPHTRALAVYNTAFAPQNSCTNAPHCYVIRTLPVLFITLFPVWCCYLSLDAACQLLLRLLQTKKFVLCTYKHRIM
jgi:hypothetical protein